MSYLKKIMNNKNEELQEESQMFKLDTDTMMRAYGEEAPLVIDILRFVASKICSISSNKVSFLMDDFCVASGYTKDEMQSKLPQFIDCSQKKKPYGGDHCFDETFEYALYKAFTTVLIFDNIDFDDKGFDLRNLILIRGIRAEYKKEGEKEMRYYRIELDYRIKKAQLEGLELNR